MAMFVVKSIHIQINSQVNYGSINNEHPRSGPTIYIFVAFKYYMGKHMGKNKNSRKEYNTICISPRSN